MKWIWKKNEIQIFILENCEQYFFLGSVCYIIFNISIIMLRYRAWLRSNKGKGHVFFIFCPEPFKRSISQANHLIIEIGTMKRYFSRRINYDPLIHWKVIYIKFIFFRALLKTSINFMLSFAWENITFMSKAFFRVA